MAEMIPDTLPASSTAGERRVFATLASLPDDCLIYYEPVVRRRYPDLIAILPEVGVLVIEVKDWRLAELGSVNADTITITRHGTASIVPHPRRQARGYMLRLMDECRRHPQAGMLMQKEGRHAGGYAFPFCHIAVLSNINLSQVEREAQELTLLFPSGTTITRDELATWDVLEPHALLASLKACFDPWWAFPKLAPAQIDIFRSVIHPEVVIRASETDLAVLDLRQERNAAARARRDAQGCRPAPIRRRHGLGDRPAGPVPDRTVGDDQAPGGRSARWEPPGPCSCQAMVGTPGVVAARFGGCRTRRRAGLRVWAEVSIALRWIGLFSARRDLGA